MTTVERDLTEAESLQRSARGEIALSRLQRLGSYEKETLEAVPDVCARLACKNALVIANNEAFDAAMSGRTEMEAALATRQKLAAACVSCTGGSLNSAVLGSGLADPL